MRTWSRPHRPVSQRLRGGAGRSPGGMLALAALTGLVTGLFAVGLIELIGWLQPIFFGPEPNWLRILAVTTLGGLAIGMFVTYAAPETGGGGVVPVMESIALRSGRMPAHVAPAKLVASAVSIGAGASGGREGPIVQIGGALGSLGGRLFALAEEQKRELIAAGAAAGIAASFNAPIGGMLFAIEVILGGFRLRYLQVVVVSSVVASVTARELIGEGLIYNPPPYRLGSPGELGLYAVLGVAAAGVGWALSRGEHAATGWFRNLRVWPPLRTALAGLSVGALALLVPEVLGTGDELPPVPGAVHEPIARLLDGEFASAFGLTGFAAAALLLAVMVTKLVATCLSIGGGFSVGSFGPSFFLGAALGAALGHAASVVFPGADVEPGALALAGMAAVLGAAARAPLTGILIAFELTGDYGMVLPLMLATGVATFAADRIERDSIYTLPLRRRGIVYSEPEDIDIMQLVRVDEVMTRDPELVPADEPIDRLQERFSRSGPHGFVVVEPDEPDRLVGMVTVSDLGRGANRGNGANAATVTAGDICTRRPLTVTPEDPVFRAVQRMASADVGRLPVVSPQDHGRLLGLIRRADVVRAYQQALTRTVVNQQEVATQPLRDLVGTQTTEVVINPGAPIDGQQIREVGWPPRTIVASIRRGEQVLTPSGDTTLAAGDSLLVMTSADQIEALRSLVTADPDTSGD